MDVSALSEVVLGIVQDDSFEGGLIDMFNICLGELAGEIDLPALNTTATVAALESASSVALPVGYSRSLYWVGSAAQRKRIGEGRDDYHNLLKFLDEYPVQDKVGEIRAVAIQGVNLLYQGSADDTLTLRFYREPAELVNNNDTPTEIPAHLHRALLVNYACREIYNHIEDGREGARNNVVHFDNLFQRAKQALETWAERSTPREPSYMRDAND